MSTFSQAPAARGQTSSRCRCGSSCLQQPPAPHPTMEGSPEISGGLLVAQMVKNLPAVQETQVRSLDGEDSPGGGNGYPLQYSCPENSRDRGACWATVHGVPKELDTTE